MCVCVVVVVVVVAGVKKPAKVAKHYVGALGKTRAAVKG